MPVLRNDQDLFPNGDFPLLEAICPPNSTDMEKATYLLGLFKMALEPEDRLNRRFEGESFSPILLKLP